MKVQLLGIGNKEEVENRLRIVACAGKLSRFKGTATEIYEISTDFEKNKKFAELVIGLGHESITDHDYFVFAIENVTPIVEQILIEERFSSFTIKSRREVDFSNSGFYVPDFYDKEGNILDNNLELKEEYKNHMQYLFDEYSKLVENNIPLEDARFILPYSFNSNIIMGIDAHVLGNLIIKLTKRKTKNVTELNELGNVLYKIMEENAPYLKKKIDKEKYAPYDSVEELLNKELHLEKKYKTISNVELLSCTEDIDKVIITSELMRIYGYEYKTALEIYEKMNFDLKQTIMKEIYASDCRDSLKQINFRFQIPITLCALTHYTRHRTHDMLIPDFVPNLDLLQYKTPETIKKYNPKIMEDIINKNYEKYNFFLSKGVREEDLVYFCLSGNTVNVETNMNGLALVHIMHLRLCEKAQWETRDIAKEIKKHVQNNSEIFHTIVGSDCEVLGLCKEGKECCGKIKTLKLKNN